MGDASYSAGTAIIRNSTISNNTAGKVGGGISNSSDLLNYTEDEVSVTSGEITVINSTISGNTAGEAGGGISNIGKLSLSNSTITLNESDDASGVGHNLGEIEIANTIISGNLDTDFNTLDGHSDSDGVESITSLGGNFIGNGDLGDAFDQPTDQTNMTDPGLNPLAKNGGPTRTHLPKDDSPVVDRGNNDAVDDDLITDQRRKNRIFNGTVDIGAVELGDPEDNDSADNNDSDKLFPSTNGDDTLRGTQDNDSLDGQGGNDLIRAYDGDETLIGSSGNDTLVGGEGRDQFVFNSADEGRDRITDFLQDEDLLIISRNGFRSGLTRGILSESQFALIDDVTSDTRFIYNLGNNQLFFDSDGSGNNNSVLLTVIDNVVGFNHTDINVV
jgi:Ca2+-binding RTX toxin-like protein